MEHAGGSLAVSQALDEEFDLVARNAVSASEGGAGAGWLAGWLARKAAQTISLWGQIYDDAISQATKLLSNFAPYASLSAS